MKREHWGGRGRWLAAAWLVTGVGLTRADQPTQSKHDAPLVIDGVVREVFRSPRQTNTDYLVQIEVHAAALGKAAFDRQRLNVPAPGDDVYVHVFQRRSDAPRSPTAGGYKSLPAEGSTVRAYLFPRAQGGWAGAYPDWFDATRSDRAVAQEVEPAAGDEAPATPAPTNVTTNLGSVPRFFSLLGIDGQLVNAGGRMAIQASSVAADSPAALAGIEPKDVIVEVNGSPLNDPAKLVAAIQRDGQVLKLGVIDSRTGKLVPVEVNVANAKLDQPARPPAETAPEIPRGGGVGDEPRDLGIDAEPVALGLRQALKVTNVAPGSLAQKAGIEPGDVIVDADGLPVSSPASLARALEAAEGTLTLTIRDVKTNKDTPVEIAVGGAAAKPTPNAPQPKGPGIGLVADPIFVGGKVALKVTEVKPVSPAQKAGFEPGDIIVAVNNTPVDSVDQIAAMAKKSGPKLKVTVLDIRTRKSTPVDLDLNAR
jgi:S1-C subfamily serine protease